MAVTNPGRTVGTGSFGVKTVWKSEITEILDYDADGVNSIRREGNKTYKYCKYAKGTGSLACVAGDVLVYKLDSYELGIVTADVSDGDTLPIMAGVAVGTIAATDDAKYIWVQIKGPTTLSVTPGGTTPGNGDTFSAEVTGGTDKRVLIDPADNRARAGVLTTAASRLAILDCPY